MTGEHLRLALIEAFHRRHQAPAGFDSAPLDCDTCKQDAAIALEVVRSPAALDEAVGLVYILAEQQLDEWRSLGTSLAKLKRPAT